MKKNLLLVLGITFAISASAQVGIKHSLKLENKPVSSIENFEGYYNFAKNNNFTPKAGGDVLWTEDFSDITASGWTIDNGTQTGNDQGWATVTSSRTWASGNGSKENPFHFRWKFFRSNERQVHSNWSYFTN